MLARLAGNDALKAELGTALRGGRLPHAVLLVGEPGCGAGFAARCLAADYLYPAGGPHAEAVLKKEDTECLVLQGEGASGQIPVKKVREAREAIQRSALSAAAAGRVLMPLLSDRIGRRPTDLILFGVSLGLSAAFLFAQGWLVVAVYAGLTFCYSALAAVLPSLSTDLFGLPHAGENYGFLALGQSVGSLAFPFAANLWGLATGRHWLAMAGAAAGFVCIWALRPVRAQQPPRKN